MPSIHICKGLTGKALFKIYLVPTPFIFIVIIEEFR